MSSFICMLLIFAYEHQLLQVTFLNQLKLMHSNLMKIWYLN